jgi:hypothetical protein
MSLFRNALVAIATLWSGTALAQANLPSCGSFPNGADSYSCTCEAGFVPGGVWGTNIYSTDSNICAAAQHAGAITAAGGPVKAVAAAGQDDYPASTQNGISSQHWGAFDKSFMFVPVNISTANAAETVEACTALANGQDRVTCSCAAGSGAAGAAWGSGPYTADSSICTAAQHAGVIGTAGGTVTAVRVLGMPAYSGSTANGVTSSDWQSFDSSLIFDRN